MGFGVWDLGFGVWGLGFRVWGLGFGVWVLRQWRTSVRSILAEAASFSATGMPGVRLGGRGGGAAG